MLDFDTVDDAMTASADELTTTDEDSAGGELVLAADCLPTTAKALTVHKPPSLRFQATSARAAH